MANKKKGQKPRSRKAVVAQTSAKSKQVPKSASKKSQSNKDASLSAPQRPYRSSWKSSREEAPKPIWAPFPLTELMILAGIIAAVIGLATKGVELVAAGLLMLGTASSELAIREHFSGYRSHSAMIAGLGAVATGFGLGFGGSAVGWIPPRLLLLLVPALVFVGAFWLLRRQFVRRTGVSFRS